MSASIAIPSDVHAFTADVSPRGVDLEGRLDLSLDALIKERRKEHKQLKKQDGGYKHKQKSQPAEKRKTPKQQKQKDKQQQPTSTLKKGQKAQRKALVNKNRGLAALQPGVKGKQTQAKTKTSIEATTAKLRQQMRVDKSKGSSSNRSVVSPREAKGTKQSNTVAQSKKKKISTQQTRKVASPTRVVQPKSGKKLETVKQQPKTQSKDSVRQVQRSNKKAKLSITITGQATKKNNQKKQKAATNVLLPGKLSQALTKKNSATNKMMKRAKNRKATATKTTQVVRKVSGQRKKN